MTQGGLTHSQNFTAAPSRPSQRGQPLRGLSVLTGHSILLTDLPICEALESSRSSFDSRAQFVWRVGSLRSRTLTRTCLVLSHNHIT